MTARNRQHASRDLDAGPAARDEIRQNVAEAIDSENDAMRNSVSVANRFRRAQQNGILVWWAERVERRAGGKSNRGRREHVASMKRGGSARWNPQRHATCARVQHRRTEDPVIGPDEKSSFTLHRQRHARPTHARVDDGDVNRSRWKTSPVPRESESARLDILGDEILGDGVPGTVRLSRQEHAFPFPDA